jgi:Tfp pilus assembly protein PilF
VIYLFRGSAEYQEKNYESAITDLNRGLSFAGDDALRVEFYTLLAESYQGLENYTESEKAFNSALEIDKDNLGVKNNYAYYLSLREKNLKLARRMSLSTIKAEPDNSTYLDTYAWILFKAGKVKQAKKFILSAIEHGGSDNEEILSHSADIHIRLGEYAAAIGYLDRIVGISKAEDALKAQNRIRELHSRMKK